MVHDMLKPAAIICKALQHDDVLVIDAIEALLKAKKSIEKLKSVSFNELYTVKKVVSEVKQEDAAITYQSVRLA